MQQCNNILFPLGGFRLRQLQLPVRSDFEFHHGKAAGGHHHRGDLGDGECGNSQRYGEPARGQRAVSVSVEYRSDPEHGKFGFMLLPGLSGVGHELSGAGAPAGGGGSSQHNNATTYYFRLVGFDYDNYSYRYGAILSFTTGKPPAVTTTAATSVTGSAATLNGR